MNRKYRSLSFLLIFFLILPLVSQFYVPSVKAALTYTFYSSTSDGYNYAFNAVYNTAWTSAAGIQPPPDGDATLAIGQRNASGTYYIDRGLLYFDTSGIADDFIIASAYIGLYGAWWSGLDSKDTDFNITVQSGMPTYPHDPMVKEDYSKALYSGSGGTFDTTGYITTGYFNVNLNSTGLGWINKTSTTKFCLRSDEDLEGDIPADNERVNVWTSEEGESGERRPKLVITGSADVSFYFQINNMEGCGDWCFANERYYEFNATYDHISGWDELDTVKLRFSDGEDLITVSYDVEAEEVSIDVGEDKINLQRGDVYTNVSSTSLRIYFDIYFKSEILDALDVDVYMYALTTGDVEYGWSLVEEDYFNIYSEGGFVESFGTGTYNHLTGETQWDWKIGPTDPTTTSLAFVNMTWRNLQSVRWKSSLLAFGDESAKGHGYVEFGIFFCDDNDIWVKGVNVRLNITDWALGWGANSMEFTVDWYNGDDWVKQDKIYGFYEASSELNLTRFVVDLWVDVENASSTFGGHTNPVYFDKAAWIGGATGGSYISQFQGEILNYYNDVISAKSIVLWKTYMRLYKDSAAGTDDYWMTQETMFNILNEEPVGTDHPTFLEPITYSKTGGWGFFEPIRQGIIALGVIIVDGITFAALGAWNIFVGFLDTVAGWAGAPNYFSDLFSYLFGANSPSLLSWFTDTISIMLTTITSLYYMITGPFVTFLLYFASIFTNIILFITTMTGVISGTYEWSTDILTMLDVASWVTLFTTVIIPCWVFGVFESRKSSMGLQGIWYRMNLLMDVALFFVNWILRITMFFIDILFKIVESIPVIE